MLTTQSAVTVIAEILPGHEAALQQALEQAGQSPASNASVPFARLTGVHFARFFILPPATDLDGRPLAARLVFLADTDSPPGAFLRAVSALAPDGLDRLYAHCRGYPGRAQLLPFLAASSLPSAATYVNTIGRTVEQIRQEASLREAIQAFLDRTQGRWRGASPRRVRAAIQEFVEGEPSLAWARRPLPPPGPRYILGEQLHMLLVGIALTVLFPVVLLGLPVWLYFLRLHEQTDRARDIRPDDARIEALAAQEDHGTQNPFTSAGFLKPGRFRRFTASLPGAQDEG
jgi:hypothetical protein